MSNESRKNCNPESQCKDMLNLAICFYNTFSAKIFENQNILDSSVGPL